MPGPVPALNWIKQNQNSLQEGSMGMLALGLVGVYQKYCNKLIVS